jgi:hypothetical protein
MRTNSILIGTGLACLLVFMIVSLPASLVLDSVASERVRIMGVSGSVWRGEIRSIGLPGLTLRRTRWQLRPLGLLAGRLASRIETELPGGYARGELSVGLNGVLACADFEAVSPVAPIARLIGIPAAGGTATVKIDDLKLEDNWPRAAIGVVRLRDVPLIVPGVTDIAGAFGSFQVSFAAETIPVDGPLVGALEDFGGALELQGEIALRPPANYAVSGLVRARPEAPRALADGLMLIGPDAGQGRREFSLTGSL